jgi:hypothetical protein
MVVATVSLSGFKIARGDQLMVHHAQFGPIRSTGDPSKLLDFSVVGGGGPTEVHSEFTLHVAFDKFGATKSLPVGPGLGRLRDFVESTLGSFESYFS